MSAPNWLGLLRWSLNVQDGTADSQFSQMSSEDKAWLEQVMKESVRDDPQRMSEILTKLKNLLAVTESYELDELMDNLEELRDIVEQIDMAQVCAKFGGCEILLQILETETQPELLRIQAIAIFATIAQNNLLTQDLVYTKQFVPRLVRTFLQENLTSSKLLQKILFAISTSIRGHPAAEEAFVLHHAQLVFDKAFQFTATTSTSTSSVSSTTSTGDHINEYPLRSKAMFIISALLTSDYCSETRATHLVAYAIPRLMQMIETTLTALTSSRINFSLQQFKNGNDGSHTNNIHYGGLTMEETDLLLQVLTELTTTESGYTLLHHHSHYETLFLQWRRYVQEMYEMISNNTSSSDETVSEEGERADDEDIRVMIESIVRLTNDWNEFWHALIRFPRQPTISMNESTISNGSDTVTNPSYALGPPVVPSTVTSSTTAIANITAMTDDNNNITTNQQILMIEPAPLEASSRVP
jgi:hypothetical protein